MSRTLGQAIIIENVVGAGGTRANERVARSEPNGTTVLINHVALLAAPSLFTNLRYDTVKDFEAVGLVNNAPMLLVGRKSIPGERPKDFVEWIKSKGAAANFAHGGIGTNSHLCGVMMGNVLGFKPTFVAYRGSAPAIGDLLAGQIDLLWDQVTNALPQVESGTLHGIAITSTERLAELKDVPTTAELGMPEINYTMWHGLYVARGTPKEIIAVLNEALRKAISDPDIIAKMKQLGTLLFPSKRSCHRKRMQKLFAADLPRVAKLVESSGASVERGAVGSKGLAENGSGVDAFAMAVRPGIFAQKRRVRPRHPLRFGGSDDIGANARQHLLHFKSWRIDDGPKRSKTAT